MTEGGKDKAKATALAGVGASVGGAGGASLGVLELAARGSVTGLSAGVVIGVGAVAGGFLGLAVYRFFKKPKAGHPAPAPNPKPE
jgi:hypothetical protein